MDLVNRRPIRAGTAGTSTTPGGPPPGPFGIWPGAIHIPVHTPSTAGLPGGGSGKAIPVAHFGAPPHISTVD
jgi:hypothetical protein